MPSIYLQVFFLFLAFAVTIVNGFEPNPTDNQKDSFSDKYRAAMIAYHQEAWETARANAEAAAQLKPDDPKLKLLLGRVAMEQKDFTFAEKEIKGAIETDPKIELGYQYLGDLYLRQKKYIQAEEAYLDFLKQKPKNADGLLKLIYSEIGKRDFVEAGQNLIQLDPYDETHPDYYFAKAALARAFNRPDEANKSLEMARTMYGNATWADYMKTYLFHSPPQSAEPQK